MEVPRDIAAAYLLQGSFYGHSIYATLYMDTWRKDSVVMLVHHVVTLVLIVSSYAFRPSPSRFTKLNIYFKSRGGSYHRRHALAADLGCLSFGFSWFWFRLYWFPLKVLYATSHCSLRAVPDIPFYFFFNALLLLLTLMNLYWFLAGAGRGTLGSTQPVRSGEPGTRAHGHQQEGIEEDFLLTCASPPFSQYILVFAAKVLTGQVQELKDLREYDAAEAQSLKPSKAE
ncbi:Ceramide synthase 1 [Saguinus oedipus]|uniref:Ceramide synthase 1 n=1 Tax=Saguinus oedipus TaxID=9490 RepID=A0ABQ9TT17_SAGOE|nr:Ceramide synthase 1 [Saguinus oedipus]